MNSNANRVFFFFYYLWYKPCTPVLEFHPIRLGLGPWVIQIPWPFYF